MPIDQNSRLPVQTLVVLLLSFGFVASASAQGEPGSQANEFGYNPLPDKPGLATTTDREDPPAQPWTLFAQAGIGMTDLPESDLAVGGTIQGSVAHGIQQLSLRFSDAEPFCIIFCERIEFSSTAVLYGIRAQLQRLRVTVSAGPSYQTARIDTKKTSSWGWTGQAEAFVALSREQDSRAAIGVIGFADLTTDRTLAGWLIAGRLGFDMHPRERGAFSGPVP